MLIALIILALLYGGPALAAEGAAQDPAGIAESVFQRTRRQLADAAEQMRAQRARLQVQLVSREARHPDRPRQVVAGRTIEEWFLRPLAEVEKGIAGTDADKRQLDEGRIAPEEFCGRCYPRAQRALSALWNLDLLEAGSDGAGLIAVFRAEHDRVEQRCRERRSALTIDDLYGAPNPRRTGYERANEAERREWWERTCTRYRALKEHLTQRRERLALETWGWQDFAFRNISARRDAHERAAGEFLSQVYSSFAYRDRRAASALDHFASFPGSPDRIITSYQSYDWCSSRPYPDLQLLDGSPGVLKLDRVGQKGVLELRPFTSYARALWVPATNLPRSAFRLADLPDRPVVPVRYAAGGKAVLLVAMNGVDAADLRKATVTVRIANVHSGGGGRVVTLSRTAEEVGFSANGVGSVELGLDELLRDSGSKVNQNAFEATVAIEVAPNPGRAIAANILHLMRQKVIVFLPGVFGSEITISRSGPVVEEGLAFPAWSRALVGAQPFTWLASGPDGNPLTGHRVTRLDLFRRFAIASANASTVYDVEEQAALVEPEGHPKLLRDGNAEPHYLLYLWPYDWRGRLENAVSQLLAAERPRGGDPVKPPYASPPSIRQILASAREAHPLVDDTVVLVGHSTGGVIMRGAVHRAGVEDLVDRAFFINVPFWGASKAYYVFLSGEMGIDFVSPELMRTHAPNMPIVYYLAPTERYPDPVTVNGRNEVRRTPGQDVGAFMTRMVAEAQAAGIYPKTGIPPWNLSLEAAARSYHANLAGEPRLGWGNCRVFWSDDHGRDTIGWVFVDDAGKRLVTWPTDGDGTVPKVSQQADFAAHPECLVEIPSRPQHVPAPSTPFVWQTIVRSLCEPNAPGGPR